MSFAQTDTLFTRNNEKFLCKITEVGPYEIKYYLANEVNGPLYVVYKSSVIKYTLANGITHYITVEPPSNLLMAKDTLVKGCMIKISPVGIIFNHITLSFESVINKKTNFELEVGYINSSISNHDVISRLLNNIFLERVINNKGFYFKPGLKFSSSRSGRRLGKPFNGGYSKIEFVYSNLNIQNFNTIATATGSLTTDLRSQAIGGFMSTGIQAPISKYFYLDFSVGIGFTKQINTYSDPDYKNVISQSNTTYNNRDETLVTNYYGFIRMPYSLGTSFNYSLKLGYLICAKSKKKKKPKNINGVHYYN
jgi:hypothetical protein